MSAQYPILVAGVTAGGRASLPAAVLRHIDAADLLVGGRRHLGYFPDFRGETVPITVDLDSVVARLQRARDRGERAAVVASGDPLCYGIGATLRRTFPAEALEIVPAPSAFQLAFAALAEPWHDAALLSAHGRPLDAVVRDALHARKAAILTDDEHTPAVIARTLVDAGLPADTACAVCENLGGSEERTVRTTLRGVEEHEFARLNVFVVWPERTRGRAGGEETPVPAGLPDDAFSTEGNQITKREVRLLVLAELALGPGEVLWDIGAGSGAVGIEAARAQPTASVYAVEKRATMCTHVRDNLARFPALNFDLVEGRAPEACATWPDPDAVFVGGSGGRLGEIIDMVHARLRPGGRLVLTFATLDHLHLARRLLPDARITQLQINRGVPILDMTRFEALNPVFLMQAVMARPKRPLMSK